MCDNSVCVFCLKHLQTSQKNVLFRCLKKKQTSLHSKKRNLFGSANFLDSIADSMPITLKLYSRRDLPLSKRDWMSLNSMDRILIRKIQQQLLATAGVLTTINQIPSFPKLSKRLLIVILGVLHERYRNLITVDIPPKPPKISYIA